MPDIIASTLPRRPEMVGVLTTVRTSLLLCSTFPLGPMCPHWAGAQPAIGTSSEGGRTTHQFFGTQGSDFGSEGIPENRNAATTAESGPPPPTSYPSGNRQYKRRGLCEQEGGLGHHLCPY